jgi:antitoxin component YwqK of YwqJK toxin-antitoxin module
MIFLKNTILKISNAYTEFLYKRPDPNPVNRVRFFQNLINIAFAILFVLPAAINAQGKMLNKQKRYLVYLNDIEKKTTTKAAVLNKTSTFKANHGRTYYWYSIDKILETQGGYGGKLLDGPYVSFYLNSNLKEKGTYKRGLKNGEWTSWNEDGILKEITIWRQGLKGSRHLMYDAKGQLILEEYFSQGLLNGKQITYESGKPVTEKLFRDGVEKPFLPKAKKLRSGLSNDSSETEAKSTKAPFMDKVKNFFKPKNKVEKVPAPATKDAEQKQNTSSKTFNKKER